MDWHLLNFEPNCVLFEGRSFARNLQWTVGEKASKYRFTVLKLCSNKRRSEAQETCERSDGGRKPQFSLCLTYVQSKVFSPYSPWEVKRHQDPRSNILVLLYKQPLHERRKKSLQKMTRMCKLAFSGILPSKKWASLCIGTDSSKRAALVICAGSWSFHAPTQTNEERGAIANLRLPVTGRMGRKHFYT